MMINIGRSIRSKIFIGYIVVILCLAVSVFIVSGRISSLQNEIDFISEHDVEVHNLTNLIEKDFLDMETGQQGYIITGDTSYLEPYYAALKDWENEYNRLYELVANYPEQQKKLETLKVNLEHWIRVAGEPTIALKKENKTSEIFDYFKTDPGKKDMDLIRTQFEDFRNAEKLLTKNRADRLDAQNRYLKIGMFVLLIAVSIISVLAAIFISRSIVNTIKEVTKTISEIASSGGDLKRRIEVTTKDEIRDLALATNRLLESQERQNWMQSRLTEVVSMYQGVSDIQTLAKLFIGKISPMLNASYGVVYVRSRQEDEVRMVKFASFTSSGADVGADSFGLGEGLIGQCAKDRTPIQIDQIPEDGSSSREAGATRTLIVPAEFEGEVAAVIELATLETFTDSHRLLLENILKTFGTAVNSVESRMEIERLLKDSQLLTEELQLQSEELQSQQEELRIANEHLEEQNRYAEEKSRELEKTRSELEKHAEQLEQSSQYKSQFLANMSHELRTPLNSMLILSQMLAENRSGTHTPEEQEYARVIYSAGEDLLNLINDILDLSKVESGKMDVFIEAMNITELPSILNHQFSQIAERKGLTFSILLDPDIDRLFYTDTQRLLQIVKNLLSNAFKFTRSGGVVLNISMAAAELTSEMFGSWPRKPSNVLAISVTDTGIGISRKKQALIFEAFQQADGTTSRQYGGTGLGLSISRELAGLLGGRIDVKSVEGEGSTFTLVIPSLEEEVNEHLIAQSECAAGEESHVSFTSVYPASEGFKKNKVLIVDEDIRNVFALKSALESEGFTVLAAHDGRECLDLLDKETDIDLVLMDIMMPVMDGYETMRNIRQVLKLERLPIIALTAKAMKEDREKCLEAGASDYISKPIDMNQLLALMRLWLSR
ncbi:CHASE3 domain-containing protein [Paenibacillus sp. sptzw28]|uniref:CHASE3 domain-containing protein n=1 Tax=Paenibacillus sp. sptzw28 TaxID=715179 RepID=UPI001C6E68A4|nr:CHASE3 domain-containing protein [Paenibacillus sp. sptzw28]QYR22823.1 CHASE3 domain-containing protein [Paenibacillus sp. sptzw28]